MLRQEVLQRILGLNSTLTADEIIFSYLSINLQYLHVIVGHVVFFRGMVTALGLAGNSHFALTNISRRFGALRFAQSGGAMNRWLRCLLVESKGQYFLTVTGRLGLAGLKPTAMTVLSCLDRKSVV